MSFLVGVLPQLFALSSFTGGNGTMDSVSHLLLGGSDWTESQEDLRLVSKPVNQFELFNCTFPDYNAC